MSDVQVAADGIRFTMRAAAIVARDREILVCEGDGLDYCFLPGGKVGLGELAQDAVARELEEELGTHAPPLVGLRFVAEGIHRQGAFAEIDARIHQVGFGFLFDGSALELDPSRWEAGHRFRWVSVDDLPSARFQPAGLIPTLQTLDETVGVAHIAHTR